MDEEADQLELHRLGVVSNMSFIEWGVHPDIIGCVVYTIPTPVFPETQNPN